MWLYHVQHACANTSYLAVQKRSQEKPRMLKVLELSFQRKVTTILKSFHHFVPGTPLLYANSSLKQVHNMTQTQPLWRGGGGCHPCLTHEQKGFIIFTLQHVQLLRHTVNSTFRLLVNQLRLPEFKGQLLYKFPRKGKSFLGHQVSQLACSKVHYCSNDNQPELLLISNYKQNGMGIQSRLLIFGQLLLSDTPTKHRKALLFQLEHLEIGIGLSSYCATFQFLKVSNGAGRQHQEQVRNLLQSDSFD